VRTFEETGSTLKLRNSGRPKMTRKFDEVSEVVQLLSRSARKPSITLGIADMEDISGSNRTELRHILLGFQ